MRHLPGVPVVKTLPSNAGGVGLIPGLGTKTPHAVRPKKQNIKQKQYCNKFNKDLKEKTKTGWAVSSNMDTHTHHTHMLIHMHAAL